MRFPAVAAARKPGQDRAAIDLRFQVDPDDRVIRIVGPGFGLRLIPACSGEQPSQAALERSPEQSRVLASRPRGLLRRAHRRRGTA